MLLKNRRFECYIFKIKKKMKGVLKMIKITIFIEPYEIPNQFKIYWLQGNGDTTC